MDKRIEEMKLYAWLGEDELGSGEIGIKQAMVPAGMIPIVATKKEKINRDEIIQQMDIQGKTYKKTIYLCEFSFKSVVKQVGA